MDFRFFLPTKIFFGPNCIAQNSEEFSARGRRALIVTGRSSARLSGALADLHRVLAQQQITSEVFDHIGENPSFGMVEAGGAVARQFRPDMIIAIGGGSPLDAAKAIAVLAANDIPAAKLYEGNFAQPPLPILAVPITAGTGSEVTPYAILTDTANETKRSFSRPDLFPRAAFLDARYTQSLPAPITVDTAVDAMSHNLEGYLSRRATPTSDALALEGLAAFGSVRAALLAGNFSPADREALLYASLLGGMVIAQTGTTVVHALGYSLTYFKQVPHGRANGLLLGEYLKFLEPAASAKIQLALHAMKFSAGEEFSQCLRELLAAPVSLTEEEREHYARIAAKTANVGYTARQPGHAELKELLRSSLDY